MINMEVQKNYRISIFIFSKLTLLGMSKLTGPFKRNS